MKSDYSSAPTSPLSSFGRFFRQLVSPSRKSPPVEGEATHHGAKCVSFSAPLHHDDIHRVFNYFDENGDGKISASELQNRLRKVGGDESQLSEEEAEMVVRTSDADGDGALGLDDFAKMMEEGGEQEEELREAFGMYSRGKEGSVITPKSLKRMLSRLGQSTTLSECKVIIGKFDVNGDGVLDFNEFRAMMR